MNAIQELIQEIANLKPMSKVTTRLLRLIEDPNSSMQAIADVIVFDPLITADVIRMCNSAYFGLKRRVNSVNDAITMVGLDKVVELVLLKNSAANLKQGQQGYGLHEGALWQQSVSAALIAKKLAQERLPEHKHLVFTAALLKDVGKVILDRFVGQTSEEINYYVQKHGASFMEAEKKVVGVDHAELGGLIAQTWQFSTELTFIIRHHHLIDISARQDTATTIVYLADTICMMMGLGGGIDGLYYRFYDKALEKLSLSDSDLQAIIADYGANMRQVEDLLNMV